MKNKGIGTVAIVVVVAVVAAAAVGGYMVMSGDGAVPTDGVDNGTNDGVDGSDGEGLPTVDQASGDEPLPRYPGSVMLEHTVLTIQGDKRYDIEYGTEDSVDDVLNWYKEEIEEEPSTEETEGDKSTLVWTSIEEYELQGMVRVEVWSNGYTTIKLSVPDSEE